ncbi:MAG: hypothetical protein KDC44_13145 [Phaeodactylibacter sp.]|nr:hypothetical protein [Phaeodactylibacter sp.]
MHLPYITAPKWAYKGSQMEVKGGKPEFFDTKVSVIIDFARNPLDKDPLNPYKYRVSSVYMKKAVFDGLQLFVGKTDPLLDFPKGVPVEVFGLHLWDYDPEVGNINLKIQDIKAKGSYHDADEKEKSSTTIEFGLDTTLDNQDPEKGKKAAVDLRYNASEDSISTKLNIASAWLPCLDLQSPELTVYNHDGNAVEVQNLEADIKYIKAKKEGEEQHPARLEIRSLRLKEINAQGINVIMREPAPEEGETTPQKQKIQEVSIPPGEPISLKNLHITGLAVDLQEGGSTLSVLDEDASIHTGETDVSGLKYEKRNAQGAVLRSLSLHRAKFDGLKLDAIERKGRPYRLDEFFKFFGRTRIENLDALATFSDRKDRGTIGVKGLQNTPISIDYHEGKDGAKDYYSIRLPLQQIRVPALHIEKDGTIIHIPKAGSRNTTSTLNDVDVRLRVHLNTDKEKPDYDIWLDNLDIGTLKVFGLEYHDTKKGIDVFFEKNLPLSIPNVKAGGFKFSSSGKLDVFGRKGGWVEAAKGPAAIEANFAKIEATLKTGSFLAEKSGGRSALDLDIASLGFHQDKAGNKTINLGAINGALPKMTVRQTDPTTGITTTTELLTKAGGGMHADSMDIVLGADKNKVIDVKGMKAGSLDIINTETKGTGSAKKELSKTTLKLGPEALGAESATVKLNADKSKELTIRDIKAGKIRTDFEKGGEKMAEVALPDPDQVHVEAVVIKIAPNGNKRILLQKPTLKRFLLKAPGKMPGDHTSILADLELAGDMELGDGNFDALNFDDPKDAFVAVTPDDTPISVSNLRLEHKDTSTPAAKKEEPDKGYNANQLKLIELEVARDKAWEDYLDTPATVGSPEMMIENPELERAFEVYDKAKKAYEKFRASIIRGAKAKAKKSRSKKYLDAVEGDAKGFIIIYGRPVFVNIETYNGKKYVRIDDQVISGIKHTLREGIGSTALSPIWGDENLIAAAKGILAHKKTWAVPSIRGLVEAIARGAGNGAVSVALDDTSFSKGRLTDDASMFGINIKVDISWLHDMGSGDEFTVGLCEYKYQHPTKKDYFELYGMIEYLQFVKPALASRSGQIDAERTERLAKGHRFSQGEFEDMDTEEAFAEMIALISFGINQEMSAIVQNIQRSISTVHVEADLTLHPEKVINEWLKDMKAGSLNFDKGSKDIKDLHIKGDYSNPTRFDPRASVGIGGGSAGTGNLIVPGATYLSADKKTKVSYDSLEIAPVNLAYEKDVYEAISKHIDLKGLKIGIKK